MDSPQFGTRLPERLESDLAQWTEAMAAFARTLRVAIPGIVKSFDATKQTVTVQPVIRENPAIAGVRTPIDMPLLTDVPVMLPRAGAFTLTLPVTAGDECLVIFADNCFDAWFQSGGVQSEVLERRHSLSDGLALIGLWSQPRKVPNWSTSSAQLRNADGTSVVEVGTNFVNVSANTANVVAINNATVQSAFGTVTVTGPTVNVSGSSAVNITGGHCSIDGKNFLNHTHSGVAGGSSQSGPVA